MMSLLPRVTVMSWEPDCFPQVMTVLISPEHAPPRSRTEVMYNRATPVTGIV
jgi:hypothetical protein